MNEKRRKLRRQTTAFTAISKLFLHNFFLRFFFKSISRSKSFASSRWSFSEKWIQILLLFNSSNVEIFLGSSTLFNPLKCQRPQSKLNVEEKEETTFYVNYLRSIKAIGGMFIKMTRLAFIVWSLRFTRFPDFISSYFPIHLSRSIVWGAAARARRAPRGVHAAETWADSGLPAA